MSRHMTFFAIPAIRGDYDPERESQRSVPSLAANQPMRKPRRPGGAGAGQRQGGRRYCRPGERPDHHPVGLRSSRGTNDAEAKQQAIPPRELEQKQADLLRDLIDQQLLLSKGKELGITGETELIKRLDEISKQNHLDSMEDLEKAAPAAGCLL